MIVLPGVVRLGSWAPSLAYALAIPIVLTLALSAPLALTTFGLVCFGFAHNILELRYLAGRYLRRIDRRTIYGLLGIVTLIALRRLLLPGQDGERLEIVSSYGLLAVAAIRARQVASGTRVFALLLLFAAAAVSLTQPSLHFIALAHLHNVLPLAFLWMWSTALREVGPRQTFRVLQLTWAVLIPALIMLGAFNGLPLPRSWPDIELGNDLESLTRSLSPSSWWETALPGRLFQAYAFLQAMHYFTWCGFLSRSEAARTGWVDRALEEAVGLSPRWFWMLSTALVGMIGVLLMIDYVQGRALYTVLASYHAYLELAVLVMVALSWGSTPFDAG